MTSLFSKTKARHSRKKIEKRRNRIVYMNIIAINRQINLTLKNYCNDRNKVL